MNRLTKRLRDWLAKSLEHRLSFTVALLALGFSLGIALLSYIAIWALLEQTIVVYQPWLEAPLNLRLRFSGVPGQVYGPFLLVSLGFAILVVGAVILAAYAARRIIRNQIAPLVALTRLASSAAEGKPVALPSELAREDEIGALARSVTDMANTLRAHGEELERQVKRRTQELSEAKNVAEAASRAKSEFFSRMSHELRTPLNAVLGFGQLLELYEDLTPEQAGAVAEIRSAGEHLLALIDDMLDLAKIEAGGIKITIESVELSSILEECRVLVLPLAAGRSIGLSMVQEGEGGAFVRADRTRLKQILLNLLSNALKFSRDGGFVRVRTARSGGEVRFAVTDSGQGISRENMAKLFVPFSRLGADSAGIKGTGIGLAIAKKLIELMRGSIGVDSVVGEGSTFWFKLPAAEGAAPAQPGAASKRGTTSSGTPEHRYDIVYIEDNPANLRLVEQILMSRPNVHLFSAHEPYLGLDLIRAHKPALVLLDINLPHMDGYEILEVIRSNPETRHIPVIAVSAAATHGDVKRGLAAGFSDYVSKPLDIRKFMAILDKMLEGSRVAQPSGDLTGAR